MPQYTFQCDDCNDNFVIVCSIPEYAQTDHACTYCKGINIYRDYLSDEVSSNYIKGLHEAETVGEYADKQTKKLSRDQKNEILRNQVTKKDPHPQELPHGMSRARKDGYIVDGPSKRR